MYDLGEVTLQKEALKDNTVLVHLKITKTRCENKNAKAKDVSSTISSLSAKILSGISFHRV